ncbi:MAG: phytanoyl-CoA dioxygenase family protein, partial [Betaproteobacteria bacterium]|nr:phytanoyl-CoA dioxygenase family protein [Betaproteobacteria bacterium]
KRLPFFARLRNAFGPFAIAEAFFGDTHVAGLEEIYWRLVRPHATGDVGPLHADRWFHQMMHMYGRAFPERCFTLKVWIPVLTEPGRNGLLLVPGSHRREWKHSTQWINGQPKPRFEDEAEPVLMSTAPGEALIFHEDLLHGGAVNAGQDTRVSTEITLVFESEAALRAHARCETPDLTV